MIDRRQFEREDHEIRAECVIKGTTFPCTVTDISPEGLGIFVEAKTSQGMPVEVRFPGHAIHAKIIYVDGHNVGVKFEKPAQADLEYIRSLKPAD